MRTRIFYFTGSGNSLAIARALADGLGGAELVAMANVLDDSVTASEKRVGMVFPVYAWGPPRMVAEFAAKLRTPEDTYRFAVATCGGSSGTTLKRVQRLLRAKGGELHAGFVVRGDLQPSLPGVSDMAVIRLIGWLGHRRVPESASRRIPEIVDAVQAMRRHDPETTNIAVNALGSAMHAGARGAFKKADRGFSVSDACISCGTCASVCPRQDIVLVEGTPTWQGDCEMCFACYLWCPERAILYQGEAPSEPRQHPAVTVEDMRLR
jgi:ferredoxin/flavodoxin